jgi:glycine dehydrogenase subunit 2
MKTIFEKNKKGRKGYNLPKLDVKERSLNELIPQDLIRKEDPELPEVSEVEVVRHYNNYSKLNYGVENGFYPLGSCTMKYNPLINEEVAKFDGFLNLHPLVGEDRAQGALQLMYELQNYLSEIVGMDAFTLQPAAGAHGEYTGMSIIKAYHMSRGDEKRRVVIVPDSAHGTNPATSKMAGFDVVSITSNSEGRVDIEELKKYADDTLAGLMLTNPNTLGLFETEIEEITKIVHDAGGLVYYDGANLNAIMGKVRPGDMGFDVVHLNLHKTFSTPHGMGGPGSGPVGVKEKLREFLPVPVVGFDGKRYYFDYDIKNTIGKVRSFYGNFDVLVKAYAYIKTMGQEGLTKASEMAVLNANYLRVKLQDDYEIPHNVVNMHEFVATGEPFKKNYDVSTLDIAKRLIDYGIHPSTVYFPLIVHEAIMIEPTETETKENLDAFVEVMKRIAKEAKENPEVLHSAPHNRIVGRLDDVQAARKPVLRWSKDG